VYNGSAWKSLNETGCGLSIGDTYQGGFIFYLDPSGCHGLIAAPSDQSTGIQWINSYTVTNAVRNGMGAGQFNTERIIANQGTGAYAAQVCANYQGGNYGDWYLPSIDELYLMYKNLHRYCCSAAVPGGSDLTPCATSVGGFANYYYWSSSENLLNHALAQSFQFGFQGNTIKAGTNGVRAVRAF
jgi:hypothetical protein